jgi:cell division protease FtsH
MDELKETEPKETEQSPQFFPGIIILIFSLGFLAFNYITETDHTNSISYSEFEKDLAGKKISKLSVDDQFIYGDYTTPQNGKTQFATPRVDPALADSLSKYGVDFSGVVHHDFFSTLFSWVAPAVIFLLIWFYGMRSLSGKNGVSGIMTAGRSRAKISVHKGTGVTFDDVAGIDEAKEELHEIIEFLQNPEEFKRLGARIPKGVLLVGPPGTGKTLLAKAVAGEAGVPFFSISGAEFIEMFVGVGAARVRDLFQQATASAPAIIFIDELDALGAARGTMSAFGGHDEREQTLNQLLAEMDGFDTQQGLVILAATNRPEILDPALLRAGRFDRQVLVDNPDQKGRAQILKVHIKNVKLSPDVSLDQVASITTGFSGAELANLVNEAAIQATRHKRDAVTMADFTMAMERIVAGLEKRSRILTPFERKVVANHEMGHTLVSLALPGTDTVHKVSIIPRGIGALGYTIQRPTEDRYIMTRDELENKVAVLLGGRAAEKLVFDHTSTGGADDLAKATDLVHSMVARFGMDEKLGSVSYEQPAEAFLGNKMPYASQKKYSEFTAQKIDEAVRNIIDRASTRARSILKENRAMLDACATELLKTETLDEKRLKTLTSGIKLPDNKQPSPVIRQRTAEDVLQEEKHTIPAVQEQNGNAANPW